MYSSESPYAACMPYQRFDDVDERLRPIRVVVYRQTQPGVPDRDAPIECNEDLHARMKVQGISDNVIESIRCAIERDNYAPKCERLLEEGVTVFVEYADVPQRGSKATGLIYPETAQVSSIGFGAGSKGAWRGAS